MNDWTRTIYTYSCQFFGSFIEFHFYAFYSSLSLKQAVVWRARREKHNHGALWLIMDLHNSLWISIDDLWISVIELWAPIIGFMEIELWSSISFDLWRSITHHSIHGDLQFAVIWSPKQFAEIHHPHDEAPQYTYYGAPWLKCRRSFIISWIADFCLLWHTMWLRES